MPVRQPQQFTDSTNLKFLHKLSGFYAQDQWKARPNLTLTLGLRYDIDFFPSAADVRVNGKMHPTNYGNVQPRVGLAYAFRQGKGVVRAGFGLFTGPFDYSDIMVGWQGASAFTNMNQPHSARICQSRPTTWLALDPQALSEFPVPFSPVRRSATLRTTAIYPDPSTLLQFPLGIREAQVSQRLRRRNQPGSGKRDREGSVRVGGIPVRARDSNCRCITASTECRTARCRRRPVFRARRSQLRLHSRSHADRAIPIYHAGTLSVRKPFAHHYSILANYTYSKSIDISTDIQLTDTPMDYLHPRPRPRPERQ